MPTSGPLTNCPVTHSSDRNDREIGEAESAFALALARDTYTGSTAGRRPGPLVTGAWWSLWLATNAAVTITFSVAHRTDGSVVDSRDNAGRVIAAPIIVAVAALAMVA